MRTRLARLLLTLAGLLAPGLAGAACSVIGPNLSYGPYDPLSAFSATTSGTVSITCDKNSDVLVEVGPSAVSGGFQPRRMRHLVGSDTLAYNLYVNAAGTSIWGNGSAGTVTLSQRVKKDETWLATIYGIMPAGQDVSVGSYADAIAITIIF